MATIILVLNFTPCSLSFELLLGENDLDWRIFFGTWTMPLGASDVTCT